jgi:hypothetical protein
MADVPHYCAACGEIHGGTGRESEEVKIAKINAERDIEVAKLQRAETRDYTEAATEQTEIAAQAEVAVAAVEGAAAVEEAIVENEVLEEIVNPEPPETTVVVQQESGPEEDEEAGTPPETTPVQSESKSNGFWDKYR